MKWHCGNWDRPKKSCLVYMKTRLGYNIGYFDKRRRSFYIYNHDEQVLEKFFFAESFYWSNLLPVNFKEMKNFKTKINVDDCMEV